jgi:hypothetical protein
VGRLVSSTQRRDPVACRGLDRYADASSLGPLGRQHHGRSADAAVPAATTRPVVADLEASVPGTNRHLGFTRLYDYAIPEPAAKVAFVARDG